MNNSALGIEHNVRITVYDQRHRIKQVVTQHNKASRNLVLGLIKFLRGEFTPSNISSSVISHNLDEAKSFIPAYINFGDGAIYQIGATNSEGTIVTNLTSAMSNIQDLSPSRFSTTKLDRELVGNSIGNSTLLNKGLVGRCQISRSAYNTDTTDSITLKLSAVVPAGYYSKNFYLDTVYKTARGSNEGVFLSELGLFSTDYNGSSTGYGGNLLARVAFNGENDNLPIIQTDEDIILVDWTIQITSIDDFYSEDNLTPIYWNN